MSPRLSSHERAEKIRLIQQNKKPKTTVPHIGVEIEFYCPKWNLDKLKEALVDNGLDDHCCLKADGSIEPPELHEDEYETGEINIVARQTSIKKVVEDVCKVLADIRAKVNATCGLHVHLDMRNRDVAKCFHNLLKFQKFMVAMVPQSRNNCGYCDTVPENTKWTNIGNIERYSAINPQAYSEHKTIEVRLHSGTVEAYKINNWIDILTAIIDSPFVDEVPAKASEIRRFLGIPIPLMTYALTRIKKFHPKNAILKTAIRDPNSPMKDEMSEVT